MNRGTKRLIVVSSAYVAIALIGNVVAVSANLPAAFPGIVSDRPALSDFLVGFGTALGPPLWWLIAQIALILLASKTGRPGQVGVGVLALFGLGTMIGALGEPLTLTVFTPQTFDPLLALIDLGLIVLPLLMLIFGVQEFLTRRRPVSS